MMKKGVPILLSTFIASLIGNVVLATLLFGQNKKKVDFDKIRQSVFELVIEHNGDKNYATCFLAFEEGICVSNYHPLSFCERDLENARIFIKSNNSDYLEAELLGYNKNKDIAVLRSDYLTSKKPINFDEVEPETGDLCYSFSNTNGLGVALFDGLISNPRSELVVDGYSQVYIQSKLAAYPGCSGGCLLGEKGLCIGMVSFRTKDKDGNPVTDFSYSIPSKLIMEEALSVLGGINE